MFDDGDELPPVIGERYRDTLRSLLGRAEQAPASPLIDRDAVLTAIERHARDIGCSASNATAAQSYGLKWGGDTLTCIREGKRRAEQLRRRQSNPPLDAA